MASQGPPGPDVSKAGIVVGVVGALHILSWTLFGTRIWTRVKPTLRLSTDDYFIMLAVVRTPPRRHPHPNQVVFCMVLTRNRSAGLRRSLLRLHARLGPLRCRPAQLLRRPRGRSARRKMALPQPAAVPLEPGLLQGQHRVDADAHPARPHVVGVDHVLPHVCVRRGGGGVEYLPAVGVSAAGGGVGPYDQEPGVQLAVGEPDVDLCDVVVDDCDGFCVEHCGRSKRGHWDDSGLD